MANGKNDKEGEEMDAERESHEVRDQNQVLFVPFVVGTFIPAIASHMTSRENSMLTP